MAEPAKTPAPAAKHEEAKPASKPAAGAAATVEAASALAPAAEVAKKGGLKAFADSLNGRERAVAVIAGLFILCVVLDLVAFRPLANRLAALDNAIHEQETIIPKKLLIFRHESRIVGTNRSLKDYLTGANLTAEEEIAMLLREIEHVSQGTGVFISKINPTEAKPASNAGQKLTVEVEGAGKIAGIKNFLLDLEKKNPPLLVEAVQLRSQGAGSDELRYKFTIVKLSLKEKI